MVAEGTLHIRLWFGLNGVHRAALFSELIPLFKPFIRTIQKNKDLDSRGLAVWTTVQLFIFQFL